MRFSEYYSLRVRLATVQTPGASCLLSNQRPERAGRAVAGEESA